jgi:hypothetical protein
MTISQEEERQRAQAWMLYVSQGADPDVAAAMLGLDIPEGMELMLDEPPIDVEMPKITRRWQKSTGRWAWLQMPPFLPGKAIPKRMNDRQLRRFEKEGTGQISAALTRLQRDLFRGVDADNIGLLTGRMTDPDIIGPFRDKIVALLREWALAGSEFGRERIEKEILGVR